MPAEISICGKPSVDLPSNVAAQPSVKFTWYDKDGIAIPNSNVSTLAGVTAPGTYTVCVDNTCLQSGTIKVATTLIINLGPDANLCNPATKVLNTGIDPAVAGNYTIQWFKDNLLLSAYDGMISITVDAAGTYKVVAQDKNIIGCNASDEIIITSSLPIPNHVEFCGPNQTVILSVTGSSTYRWYNSPTGGIASPPGNTFTVTPPVNGATYYVVDASNPTCQRVAVMAKVAPNCCYALTGTTLTPSVSGDVCAGSGFNITYSGGQAGDSLMLQRKVGAGSWTNIDSAKLSDPYTFTGISITSTSDFRVVTYSNGTFATAQCKDYSTPITVNVAISPVKGTPAINTPAICEGENFTLSLTGYTGSIQWQRSVKGGDFADIAGATADTYTDNPTTTQSPVKYRAEVKISGASCPSVYSDEVEGKIYSASAGISLTPSVAGPVCAGSPFDITYRNGQTGDSLMLQSRVGPGSWNNIQAVKLSDPYEFKGVSISNTSEFRVVTYSNGEFTVALCKEYSDIFTINLAVSPVAGTASISPGNICKGESVSLSLAGSTGNIQWQRAYAGGSFSDLPSATAANYIDYPTQSPVQYRATVGGTACPNVISNTVSAVVSEIIGGNIFGASIVCDAKPVSLSLNGYSGAIQWQDSLSGGTWKNISGQTSASLTFYPSDTVATDFIRVVVTDPSGSCNPVVSNAFIITSDTCATINPIYLSNALTPNGDGSNDVFYIGNIGSYPDNHLTIFNRWGSKVFEAKGYNNDWDGGDLPVATYYYVLELGKDSNGNSNKQNTYKGTVTIVR